jgi:proteasome lid subunit RPN8/RPN11
MSDVQDPLQDSFEDLEGTYPQPDKKIIFGARKPTEEATGLVGIPLIIEAPFPNERTLQWLPDPLPNGRVSESVDVATTETDPNAETTIVVSQEVLLKVNEHVSQTLERELGGFLLGNRYRCPTTARDYVIIDQYSPAKFTESNEIRLAFTHEAWAQLSDELSGKFLGKLLVGWYHSHPRMDVFLSSHDMDIQTERFPEPWMVALVLEPEKHRGGFFCSREGRVKPNSPVEFFELLERNTRDSVLAWENYTALDPSTSATPTLSVNNTATTTSTSSQEIQIARSKQSKKVSEKRGGGRKRWLLFVAIFAVVFGTAAGVVNRRRLRPWIQQKFGRAVEAQPTTTPQPQPSEAPSPIVTPTQASGSASASPTAVASPQPQASVTAKPQASPSPNAVASDQPKSTPQVQRAVKPSASVPKPATGSRAAQATKKPKAGRH